MKKFLLEAEFLIWNGTDDNNCHQDFISQECHFEDAGEARIHLDSIIVRRMSSRPGWNYRLLHSKITELLTSGDAH